MFGYRNADYYQTDSNSLPQCSLYGSIVKQMMIPQIMPTSSQTFHTVLEEDEGRKEDTITSSEDCISLTRDMLKNMVSNTFEE